MIQLIFNFGIVAAVIANLFQVVGASDKVVKLMQYIPQINTKGGSRIEAEECMGELELKNITFSYPSKPDINVLNDVSIKVNKN